MAKRHQASRRRSYGRRQHELREREVHRDQEPLDLRLEFAVDERAIEAFGQTFGGRLRGAMAD